MEIIDAFIPGAIGSIVQLHGQHYAKHWGFGTFFEAKVAAELAEFASRKQPRDLALIAHDGGQVLASLILDLHDPGSGNRGAHLRWFICSAKTKGQGVGRDLLQRAVTHADAHSDGKIWLTTFAGLEPARHLYQSFGFQLVTSQKGQAWGTVVEEQLYQRG